MSKPDEDSPWLRPIEPLSRRHNLSQFNCGRHPSLDDWLKRFAWVNQQNEVSRTYVVQRDNRVVGYYSIAAGRVDREDAPAPVARGLARHPVPIVLLTRLAVDGTEQGTGLGKTLLKDALIRIAGAADIVGARAVLVHAIDEEAAAFYRHFDFEPSPVNDLHLMLLMNDLRSALGG